MQYLNPYIEICLEGNTSIFKGLNQKDKDSIAQHHTLSVVRKGEAVFNEGDKSKGLICLTSGKVKLYKEGVGGREQILRMLRQNDFIGYRTLFSENIWSASATAIEDTTFCILDRTTLIKILKKNTDLSLKFLRLISEELGYAYNRTVSLSQKHIRGRLAESLLILRDTYGLDDDGKAIKIALSREDIANLSNMTTSNAIRTLSNLASEGIIGIQGRKISILETATLEHISELG